MALILNDRVRETTAVTGTGSATLLGAVTGYQSFSTIGNGNTTYYTIADQGGPNWEVGLGTYSSGTLARTTVLSSSNSGSLVNFTAGTKDVFVTQPSEKAVYLDGSGNITPSSVGPLTVSSLTDSGLTSGRVTYATTGGLLTDSAGFTYSSPTLTLSYSDNAFASGLQLTNSNAGSSAQSKISLTNSSGNTLALIQNSAAVSSGVAYIGTSSTQALTLGTGYAEYMRIDSSGNVGIGTGSPSYKLDIVGEERITTSTNTGGLIVTGAVDNTGLAIASTNTGGGTWKLLSTAGGSGYGQGSLAFEKDSSLKMLLDSSGNLLVGGTTSRLRLTVRGLDASAPTLGTASGSALLCNSASSSEYGMMFGVASSGYGWIQQQRVDGSATAYALALQPSGGYVGIGTSSPSYLLTVNGTTFTTGITISTGGGTNSANTVNIDTDGAGTARYYSHGGNTTTVGSHSWHLVSSNGSVDTIAMSLSTSGYLGIGYTSPASKLDIRGTSATADSTIQIVGNGVSTLLLGQNSSGGVIRGQGGSSALAFWVGGSGDTGAGQSGSEVGRFDSSGSLLVGETSNSSASGKLSVNQTSTSTVEGARITSAGQYSCLNLNSTNATFTNTVLGIGSATGSGTGFTLISAASAAGTVMRVLGNGNLQNTNNSYGAISDIKLKENIVDSSPKLADLCKVKIRQYNLINDKEKTKQLGVIAQELETVFPSLIEETIDRDSEGKDTGATTKSVKYSVFVPMLIKAIQEQQALITTMQAKLKDAGILGF